MWKIIKTSMWSWMSTAPKKNIEVSTEQEENKNNVNREQEDNTEEESE